VSIASEFGDDRVQGLGAAGAQDDVRASACERPGEDDPEP
jgi:hypothetical protein